MADLLDLALGLRKEKQEDQIAHAANMQMQDPNAQRPDDISEGLWNRGTDAALGLRSRVANTNETEQKANEYSQGADMRAAERHLKEADTAIKAFALTPFDPEAYGRVQDLYNKSGMFDPGVTAKMVPDIQNGTFRIDLSKEADDTDEQGNVVGKKTVPVDSLSMTPQQIYTTSFGGIKTQKELLEQQKANAETGLRQAQARHYDAESASMPAKQRLWEAQAIRAEREPQGPSSHFTPYAVDDDGNTKTYDARTGQQGPTLPGSKRKTGPAGEGYFIDEELGGATSYKDFMADYRHHVDAARKSMSEPMSKVEYANQQGLKWVSKGSGQASGGVPDAGSNSMGGPRGGGGQGASPYPEGTPLTGPGGKKYVVRGGIPVPE